MRGRSAPGESRDARPIGFFDSGVGGLTVLHEVVRRLPHESTIYVGDNARTPYGPRPDEEVIRFSAECLDQLAKLRLVDRLGAKVALSELGQLRLAQSQEEQFLAIIRAARDHQPGLRLS